MINILSFFREKFEGKKICILGFGREGKSTYQTLRNFLPESTIAIADKDLQAADRFVAQWGNDPNTALYCGTAYLDALAISDIVIKSPGISYKSIEKGTPGREISFTSQTELFLQLFRDQTIGVTGTKGKSTTVSLLYQIFRAVGKDTLLVGNIGLPPLDFIEKITPHTSIIFEMSSHQLENSRISPATAILLNIFQEHLDHYKSYRDYQLAKMNIARWQQPNDHYIFNQANEPVNTLTHELDCPGTRYALNGKDGQIRSVAVNENDLIIHHAKQNHIIKDLFLSSALKGNHNRMNISAAALVAHLHGIDDVMIAKSVSSFKGLAHRLERVREWHGITFYNDSISTIPEAAIEALKALPNVETLLLGGYDRGIDYSPLTDYLKENSVKNLLFIGAAGQRISALMADAGITDTNPAYPVFDNFENAVNKAIEITTAGHVCLLSPAAASYDMFGSFEQRGEKFRQMILDLPE